MHPRLRVKHQPRPAQLLSLISLLTTHPLYNLWHSTAVNILWGSEVTRQRMPLNAMQWNGASSFKMCLFSWATDASLQNQQFEVDMHQNSYLLLLRLAYHRVQQFWLTFCLWLSTGTAVFARASAHPCVWHFENVKFYPHEKICQEREIWWPNPAAKALKAKQQVAGLSPGAAGQHDIFLLSTWNQ